MPAIEVRGLRKTYGDVTAVEDVSFEVAEGEIFGILGPNGAGKTTTVECVSGLRTPDAGEVRVLGLDPRRDREDVRQVLGVQLQESQLPGKIHGRARRWSCTRRSTATPPTWTGCWTQWDLTEKAGARFGKLSGGQKQRLAMALAMVGKPRVVVLDELTTGLDPHARRNAWEMVEAVRDSGVTVLLVTHFMEEAERLCDRVAIIDAGRVVALDTPAALAARGPAAGAADAVPALRAGGGRGPARAARGPQRRAARRTSGGDRDLGSHRGGHRATSPGARSSPPSCASSRAASTTPSSR